MRGTGFEGISGRYLKFAGSADAIDKLQKWMRANGVRWVRGTARISDTWLHAMFRDADAAKVTNYWMA